MIDRAGLRSRLRCPPLPPPLHLLAGVFTWPALSWRDRFPILQLAGPIRAAQRMGSVAGDGGEVFNETETVDQWLLRHGQTPRLREMLWEPLALAALNQPTGLATAGPFVS